MLDASTRWLGVCVGQGVPCFTRSFGLSNEENDSWGEGTNEGIECWIRSGGGILSDGGCGT